MAPVSALRVTCDLALAPGARPRSCLALTLSRAPARPRSDSLSPPAAAPPRWPGARRERQRGRAGHRPVAAAVAAWPERRLFASARAASRRPRATSPGVRRATRCSWREAHGRHRQQSRRRRRNLGSADAARAAPDGYTWPSVPLRWARSIRIVYKRMAFKIGELVPVTMAKFSSARPSSAIPRSAASRWPSSSPRPRPRRSATPGRRTAGVPGPLAMELLPSMAGFQMSHVPYKGPSPAETQDVRDHVPCGLLAGPTGSPARSRRQAGRACCPGTCRSFIASRRADLAEAGVPGYAADFPLVSSARRAAFPTGSAPAARPSSVRSTRPDVVETLKAGDQTVVGNCPPRPRRCRQRSRRNGRGGASHSTGRTESVAASYAMTGCAP